MSSNKTSKLKTSARTEQLKFLFSLELHSLDKVQSYAADPYNMYNLLKWHFRGLEKVGGFTDILWVVTRFRDVITQ